MIKKRQSVRKMALKLLSKRQHTEIELIQKLELNGFDQSEITEVVEDFQALGYLDDLGYAKRFVESKRKLAKSGKLLLASQLKSKGLRQDVIYSAIDNEHTDDDEFKLAKKAVEKKLFQWEKSDGTDIDKIVRRTYSFLKRKGFSDPIILQVVREIADGNFQNEQ